MANVHAFLVLTLFVLSTDAQHLVNNPVNVPTRSVGGRAADKCPTVQDITAAQDELGQSISGILTDITTCGGTTGWRRVVNLDMTDPSQSCPSGTVLKLYSPTVRSCGRANQLLGCSSTFFNIGGEYSRVCGRIRGYQFGSTSAFLGATATRHPEHFEGLSLFRGTGTSRTHIWTFAAGLAEVYAGRYTSEFCPCVDSRIPRAPALVGNDYFCESGQKMTWTGEVIFFPDPLWDGQNCTNSACCQVNGPPYFTKVLPAATSDDIEMQFCSENSASQADVPFDQIQLYVQ